MAPTDHQSRSPDDSPPPAKRPKVFRACNQCVTSKTRCEDVKPKGCWLCRRRGKGCSLAGAISVAPPSPSDTPLPPTTHREDGTSRRSSIQPPAHPSVRPSIEAGPSEWGPSYSRGGERAEPDWRVIYNAVDETARSKARIESLEEEVRELRRAMSGRGAAGDDGVMRSGLPHRPHTSSAGRDGPFPWATDSPAGPDSQLTHLAHYAQLEDFSETIFSLSTPDAFPSVVSAGILRPGEIDLAFQSFKHHFSTIIPLAPFLSISTTAPTHNFIILAILHHVPAYASPRLAELVDKSIIVALSGNVSFDAVLPLLILSLAPPIPAVEGEPSRPSPLRLISLAYQLGRDLGMDAKVEGYLRRGTDLAEGYWAEAMHMAQVWALVVSRYILLHLMHGHGRQLPSSLASLLPRSPNPIVQQTTDHLMDESRLICAAIQAMKPLMEVENGEHDFEAVRIRMEAFQTGLQDLIAWKRSGGSTLLDLDQGCLEYIAISRLSFLFQRIPSPLQPIRQTLIAGMTAFVSTAQRFLGILFPDLPPDLPSIYASPFTRPYLSHPASTSSLSPYEHQPFPTSPIRPEKRFPAHVSMCASLAVLSLRGTAAHIRQTQGARGSSAFLQSSRLQQAEVYLRGLGGRTEALIRQADKAFGTLDEMVRWSEEGHLDLPNPQLAGGLGTDEGVRDRGEGAGQGHSSEQAHNSLMSSGLFDFDLFSWDPNFLNPDWLPNTGQPDITTGWG